MTVGHSKSRAVALIGGGLASVALGIYAGVTVTIFVGVVASIAGWLMMYRPLFEVTETTIVTYALIGPLKRTMTFASKRESLIVENDRLYVDGKPRFKRATCDVEDWQRLERQLRSLAA